MCVCWRDCGCTGYAKKRRLLRQHRVEMRIMSELIEEHGLDEELEERVVEETGNNSFWLGEDGDGPFAMDEGSDQDDPVATGNGRVGSLLGEAEDRALNQRLHKEVLPYLVSLVSRFAVRCLDR